MTAPRPTDPVGIKHLISRSPALQGNSAYDAFVTALETSYGLNEIPLDNVRWVETEPVVGLPNIPPRVALSPGKGLPAFAITLDPTVDGQSIAGNGHHAALLLVNRTNWGVKSESLGRYLLSGYIGKPDAKANFDSPTSLNNFIAGCPFEDIQRQLRESITDETPVIELAGLLPFAQDREFNTEFNPVFISSNKDLIILISADKVHSRPCVYKAGGGPFQYRDSQGKTGNWHADRIPDLSEIERATMPSSAGHFIAISIPLKDEVLKSFYPDLRLGRDLYKGNSTLGRPVLRSSSADGNDPFSLAELLASLKTLDPAGAAITGVNVTGGSQRRETTSIYTGDLDLDASRTAAIYHLTLFGVTPEQAGRINTQTLKGALGSLNNFQVIKN